MEFPNSPANGGTGSQLPQQTTVTRKVLTVGFGGTNLADITVKRDPVTVNHGQPASTVARFIVPSCSMNSFLGQRPTIRSSGTIFTVPANISQPKPPQLAGSQQTFIVSPQVFRPGLNSHPSGDSSGASTSGNTVVVAVSSSGGLTDIKHGGPSFFKSAPGVSYHPTTSRVVVSPSQAGAGTRTVGFQASVNAPPGRVHLLPVDASEPQSDGNQNPYRSMQRGHFPINVSTYEDHHASSSGNNAGFKLRPGGSFEPDYHERIVKAAGGYSVIPPPIYAHHSSAFATRRLNSKSNALARRPCSCNRSMCLKLYCDCFANGEFCRNCNCTNCHNNLAFESDRTKAIKGVLDRNPRAFHPKVAGKGYMTEKKHYKGCNCKKSACLKNYCECYEAKVTCGIRCKCLGCRNTDVKRHAVRQSTAKSLMHLASVAEAARHVDQLRKDAQASVTPPYNQPHPQATPGMVSVAPSTSSQPSSSQGEPGTSSSTMSSMHGTASPFPNVSMAQAERELTAETPWSLLRDDIVESTAHCLLATVHDLEQGAFPPGAVNPGLNTTVGSPMLGEAASAAPLSSSVLVEKAIIKEFGRCLRTLMETAADMRADALLTLEEMGSAEGIVPPQEAPRPPGTARPAPTTGAILLPSVQARLRRETEQRQQERAEMIRERSAVATNHDGGREDEQEEPDDVEYQYERDDEDDDDEVETEEQP